MNRPPMHDLQELVRLHRLGTPYQDIARMLGMSRNTERQYRQLLEPTGWLCGDAADLPPLAELRAVIEAALPAKASPRRSSIEAWRERVEQMLEDGATPTAIYDRLRTFESEFAGTLSALKRMAVRWKKAKGIDANDVAIVVETEPGEVAQVDFGYVGMLHDPDEHRERKAYLFQMVLGHSRHQVNRIVFDQKLETWLALHVEAFEELGGVPKIIVPDNLRSAVVKCFFAADEPTLLNRSYRELARHYGFRIDPTPPYSPEKKGKVESGIKYVKNNFFATLDTLDVGKAREELAQWTSEVAGRRRHGTTQKVPLQVFESVERVALLPLPAQRFRSVIWHEAKVHRDTHFSYKRGLYSVPWRFIGKTILVRATAKSVEVYYDDMRISTHEVVAPGRRSTMENHLPEHRRDLRHRDEQWWIERATAIDAEVGAYIREVFESDRAHYQLRTVQAIVKYLEQFPVERARAACKRARFYGSYKYGQLKRILIKALDKEPLPMALLPASGGLQRPKFARNIQELLRPELEKDHAPQ